MVKNKNGSYLVDVNLDHEFEDINYEGHFVVEFIPRSIDCENEDFKHNIDLANSSVFLRNSQIFDFVKLSNEESIEIKNEILRQAEAELHSYLFND
jgi:hypothetical protein